MVGIYRIRNIVNDKCYYGSSKQIEKRFIRHKRELKNNIHINCVLQRAWDKYGENNFIFEIVELCNIELLLEIEQKYLDTGPEYNIGIKSSGGNNLTRNPNKGRIVEKITKSLKQRLDSMTEEEKKEKYSRPGEKNSNWRGGSSVNYCICGTQISTVNKTCIKCRDTKGTNNHFFGKKHSEETKKKLSENRKGIKPANIKPVSIEDVVYESLAEASRQTGIPSPTILWRIKSKNTKYLKYLYYQSHPSIKAPLSN